MGKMKNKAIELEEALESLPCRYDRFDLEQEIIQFSMILEDLKAINRGVNGINNRQIDNVINYYEDRYNKAWEVFEHLIHTRQM